MKKTILIALVLLCACAFASASEEITWDRVLEANDPMNVVEKYGAMHVWETGGDGSMTLFMENGDFRWIYDGNNLVDGVNYQYNDGEETAYVSFLAPDTEPIEFVRDYLWDTDIRDFEPTDAFEMKKGQLYVKSKCADDDYGVRVEAEFYLNAETLLIERVVSKATLGWYTSRSEEKAVYGDKVEILYDSYPVITQSEDAIDVSVHYPDGTVKNLRLARGSEIYMRQGLTDWSVCLSAEGESSISDFAWVTGDHANVYIVPGDIAPAKPTLSRIIERTSFESIMARNYNTMNISLCYADPEENPVAYREIGWYLTEENGLELYHETRDADYEVDYSSAAVNGALYEWDAESGYRVTFFADFSYAENALFGVKPVLDKTTLTDNFVWNEDAYCWYILHTEALSDGGRREYRYNIDGEFDMISHITIADYDKDGALVQTAECDIYGNAGETHERNIRKEFERPDGAKKIRLTVVMPDGSETVYTVRSDAAVSFEGKPVYLDKELTIPASDLQFADGKKATVYAGK